MKFNWKVAIALVVLVGAAFWGVNSLGTRSYSGTDLNFGVGGGPVTVTNSTDASVPAQLVGAGTSTFSVSSTAEGVSGSSERQSSSRVSTHMFEFDLPTGVTELMIVSRRSAVNFVANSGARLDVTVQPLTANAARETMIVAAIVILGSLFYMSRATDHRWINLIRREKVAI